MSLLPWPTAIAIALAVLMQRPEVRIWLALTIAWYRSNASWVARVRSGEYRGYYQRNYGNRAATR